MNYYAANLPVIALPQIEILDVDAVLDYKTTAATLKRVIGQCQGVWLIRWQDEVVDPNAMTRLILELRTGRMGKGTVLASALPALCKL